MAAGGKALKVALGVLVALVVIAGAGVWYCSSVIEDYRERFEQAEQRIRAAEAKRKKQLRGKIEQLETRLRLAERPWAASEDGDFSLRIAAERDSYRRGEDMVLLAELRNNTMAARTVLPPFGNGVAALSHSLRIIGARGKLDYVGDRPEYHLGPGAFPKLGPGETIIGRLTVPSANFPGIDRPDVYIISYEYWSGKYPGTKPPAQPWTGTIRSADLSVRRLAAGK